MKYNVGDSKNLKISLKKLVNHTLLQNMYDASSTCIIMTKVKRDFVTLTSYHEEKGNIISRRRTSMTTSSSSITALHIFAFEYF